MKPQAPIVFVLSRERNEKMAWRPSFKANPNSPSVRLILIAAVVLALASLLPLASAQESSSKLPPAAYDMKRVSVQRFLDKSSMILATRIQEQASKLFKEQGFSVIEPRVSRKAEWKLDFYDTMNLAPSQVKELGKFLKADLVVGGMIEEFEGDKKFRAGNLLAFPLGVGFILYGKVVLRVKIYDAATGQVIWTNEITRKKKNFVGGLYQGEGAVLDKALSGALRRLLESFFKKEF